MWRPDSIYASITTSGIEQTIKELEKILADETKKETQKKKQDENESKEDAKLKKEEEEVKRDFNDAIDIEKEIEALENKEFG